MSKLTRDTELLVCLFAVEGAIVALGLSAYKKAGRPLIEFLPTSPGLVFLLSIVVVGLSLIAAAARSRRRAWADIRFTLVMNVIVLLLTGGVLEGLVRGLSVREDSQLRFAGTTLLPRSWTEEVVRSRESLSRMPLAERYFTFDAILGWTVAPDRRSANGLYVSSPAGIRSSSQGLTFPERGASSARIALVGDSFTFGLEVTYEDTWGAQLESALGHGIQVLNFGVDGYGVDQAYLRYRRDVRPWRPDVVVLGLIDHDFVRTMSVYSFLVFGEGAWPFPKPRFVLTQQGIEIVNVPLPSPEAILAEPSVGDLPFITYDMAYNAADWESRFYYASYFVRFMLSRFPRLPRRPDERWRQEADELNRRIVRKLMKESQAEDTAVLIVYMPSRWPLEHYRDMATESEVQRILRAEGLAFIDTAPCVRAVPPSERFVGRHYSRQTNARVAQCLVEPVTRLLNQRRVRHRAQVERLGPRLFTSRSSPDLDTPK